MKIFKEDDVLYINDVLEQRANNSLKDFITNHPNLENDILLRDPRLKLIDVKDNNVIFSFEGIKDDIILNKDGAFIENVNHEMLSNAVQFIEANYGNIEQSISLPKNSLTEEQFVL